MRELTLGRNCSKEPKNRHHMRNSLAAIGFAAFTLGVPATEGIFETAYAQTVRSVAYNPDANPFTLNDRMRTLITGFNSQGTTREKIEQMHRTLNGTISVVNMSGRPPRTAIETLEDGGDCTDLANIVVAILQEMNIPGGVLVVHFGSAPAGIHHMIPYAQIGNERVIIDLQSSRLGETADGGYSTIMTLSYSQAASVYHSEWGDYFRDQGRTTDAITAYERSLAIYESAYAHQNLGILYESQGDMEQASSHFRRAVELDPQYRRDVTRGSYNEELQQGERAYREGRWDDCVRHFQNALDSGERISADERATIEQYRDVCRERGQSL
ncbi:tetratricopeptide repeat protein [Candidatus Micrarchaeota archaeon]|nr:tetratricopeptide repeat protein [Candidatus Micrarchaeota archaeon]